MLSTLEGTQIQIGEDCMLSSDIWIATGDGHSILNSDGERTNGSRDVNIGRHVWVGYKAIIHKGVRIPDDSVVGIGSVCKHGCIGEMDNKQVIIAGNPAVIVKNGILWDRRRI